MFVAVEPAPRLRCHKGDSKPPVVDVSVGGSGALASVVTVETDCGSVQSPWQLVAHPGQRINFTLVDFTRHQLINRDAGRSSSSSTSKSVCFAYAIFREVITGGVDRTNTLCGSLTDEREMPAFLSHTDRVTVTVMPGVRDAELDMARYFLLKYEGRSSSF